MCVCVCVGVCVCAIVCARVRALVYVCARTRVRVCASACVSKCMCVKRTYYCKLTSSQMTVHLMLYEIDILNFLVIFAGLYVCSASFWREVRVRI